MQQFTSDRIDRGKSLLATLLNTMLSSLPRTVITFVQDKQNQNVKPYISHTVLFVILHSLLNFWLDWSWTDSVNVITEE